jgi:hypothetical protein
LESSKQDVIDSSNKLAIANVNLGSSALSHVDISAPLQAQLTDITDTIATLTTLQNGDATSFTSINGSISTINTTLAGKQDSLGNITSKFTYLSNVTSDIQTQIDNVSSGGGAPSIAYDAPTTTTTISDTTLLSSLKFGDKSTQTTAFTSAKNTELSTATSNIATLQTDMTTAQADILLKQDIIDSSNKLAISNVDLGSSALSYVDISSSLQTQMTGITTALSALQDADTAQGTLNTSIASDITDLQTAKQNVIDASNKISSAYVSYNASDVNTELSNINTALGDKANLANPTFTGTVAGITKAMVGLENVDNTSDASKPISTLTQSALDLKAPLANPTFTGTVAGITKTMVRLGNVDNTSDANKPVSTAQQTALDLKVDIAGTLMTGLLYHLASAERCITATVSSNVVSIDVNNCSVFCITGTQPTANFTVHLIGLPTASTNGENVATFTISLIYTANFYASAVSAGTSATGNIVASSTPLWNGGSAPTLSTATLIIQTFTVVRAFNTKYILSNVTSFA